ncbi:MAG: phage portal protein [Puniceicoccaceae bacterium]
MALTLPIPTFIRRLTRSGGDHQIQAAVPQEFYDMPTGGLADFKDLLSGYDHRKLLSASRSIYKNFALVRGTIRQIAIYTVGTNWLPQYNGTDERYRIAAESWLRQFMKISNVRGAPFCMQTDTLLLVITLLRDGEAFILKTTHTWRERIDSDAVQYPAFQYLEAHRIGNPRATLDGTVMGGRYDGAQLRNGIAYNAAGRPLAYHFLSDDPAFDTWIDAKHILHVYDPEWFSQGRGISPLLYGIFDWLDVKEIRDSEKIRQRIAAAISILETNESGEANKTQSRFRDAGSTSENAEGQQKRDFVTVVKRGMFRFLKYNERVEAFKGAETPTLNTREFVASVIRGALIGIGWTYEAAIDGSGLSGTGERRDIAKCEKAIEHWQSVIRRPWTIQIQYATAVADIEGWILDEAGKPVAPPLDKWNWAPQLPRRMSIDNGRDAKAIDTALRNGSLTMIEEIRAQGRDEDAHCLEVVRWWNIRNAYAKKHSIPLEEFGSRFPNQKATPTDDETD